MILIPVSHPVIEVLPDLAPRHSKTCHVCHGAVCSELDYSQIRGSYIMEFQIDKNNKDVVASSFLRPRNNSSKKIESITTKEHDLLCRSKG